MLCYIHHTRVGLINPATCDKVHTIPYLNYGVCPSGCYPSSIGTKPETVYSITVALYIKKTFFLEYYFLKFYLAKYKDLSFEINVKKNHNKKQHIHTLLECTLVT